MKLSLILPVYNVEQYLKRCLDSCLEQNLPQNEYEIIIVNDGSPDHSIDIANSYAEKYKCIKIITQKNGGLSSARNTGLKHAVGDYVWFIDSDDYIKKNCISGIYHEISNLNLDVLWIKWRNENELNKEIPLYDSTFTHIDYNIYEGLDFMDEVMGIYYFAWSFVFSRAFLMKHELLFQEGLYYEDSEFAYRALPLISRIKLYDKVCYTYKIRQGSIAQTFSKKKINDLLYIANKAIAANKIYRDKIGFLRSATNLIVTALFQSISFNYKEGINNVKTVLDSNDNDLIICGSKATRLIVFLYNKFGFTTVVMIAKLINSVKILRNILKR